MKSAVTENSTSIESVTVLKNPNYTTTAVIRKLRRLRRCFFLAVFRLAVIFVGGFTATAVKIQSGGAKFGGLGLGRRQGKVEINYDPQRLRAAQ